MNDADEIARLRQGLERVKERHALATWAWERGPGPGKDWHDGLVTAYATCSLIADEYLDPEGFAAHQEEWRLGSQATDREWFKRTGRCGHCGNLAGYCVCTEDDPCGCGPHEPATEPLRCGWCRGTGFAHKPKPHQGQQLEMFEKPDLRAVLVEARAELDRWGFGDFHYGDTPRDPGVLAMLAKIDTVLGDVSRQTEAKKGTP